jgi:hypothetical protein
MTVRDELLGISSPTENAIHPTGLGAFAAFGIAMRRALLVRARTERTARSPSWLRL